MKTIAVINRYAAWIVAMIFMFYWMSMMAYSQMEWIFPSFARGISHEWQGYIWLIGWIPFVLVVLWCAAAEFGYIKVNQDEG